MHRSNLAEACFLRPAAADLSMNFTVAQTVRLQLVVFWYKCIYMFHELLIITGSPLRYPMAADISSDDTDIAM